MNKEELAVIIENHGKWLRGEDGGGPADLRGASLRGADLRGADLSYADLRYTDLSYTNLRGADLRGVDLHSARLIGANLRGASLRGADLRGADLSCANLGYTDLSDTNLVGANLRGADLWLCSGEGGYIKSLFVSDDHRVVYTSEVLQIGSKKHKISEWWEFDDRRISEMGGKEALKFWREWKDTIRMIIEKSPAKGPDSK